jgi:catechol 2,3-dioxygenase-like lactoylglutathione lyase family enzyme
MGTKGEAGSGTVSLSVASVLTDDIVALSGFYADVFGLEEVVEFRTDIFRGLDLGGVVLGFSPLETYGALGIEDWADARGTRQYLTFEVSSSGEVERLSERAVELGARIRHEPYETAYGSRQSVLADPEENVFRINHFRPSP